MALLETALTIGAVGAATTTGAFVTAGFVRRNQYYKTAWAQNTGIPYWKHLRRKYFNLKKNDRIGYAGEFDLSKQLERVRGVKRLLFNVLLPDPDGGTTEVDALMVHETGLYVFENKNYSAVIGCFPPNRTGSSELGPVRVDAKDWSVVYGPRSEVTLYNPILQNLKHVRFVKRWMQLSHIFVPYQNVFSYVAFNDNARVKGVPLSFELNCEGRVLMARHVAGEINNKLQAREKVFDSVQVEKVAQVFEPFSNATPEQMQSHVSRLRGELLYSGEQPEKAPKPDGEKNIEEYTPLQDAIHSAKQQHNDSGPKSVPANPKSLTDKYMNMFRQ